MGGNDNIYVFRYFVRLPRRDAAQQASVSYARDKTVGRCVGTAGKRISGHSDRRRLFSCLSGARAGETDTGDDGSGYDRGGLMLDSEKK